MSRRREEEEGRKTRANDGGMGRIARIIEKSLAYIFAGDFLWIKIKNKII